jgi:multisubunit Na+/H+ antiporter MnhE subunit
MIITLIQLLTLLLFRTFLWGLITANFDQYNLLGGLVLSVIIPVGNYRNLKLKAILPAIIKLIIVPIQMLKETIELMLIRDPEDVDATESKDENAIKGSRLATFIDVLVITATPMSLVTGIQDEQTWKTHTLRERGEQQ